MDRNFSRALSAVLKHEGGFVDHKDDPGGATNKGITISTYRRYVKRNGTVEDLKRITDAEVAKVYRKHYWDLVRGDELPDGIDYAVFDFAVNSGPSRAAKYLQIVLGVKVDGKIGPVTLEAARKADARKVINILCDNRLRFLQGLNTWPTFGRGWDSRVAGVRKLALSMTGPKTEPSPAPEVPTQPRQVHWIVAAILFVVNLFRKGA